MFGRNKKNEPQTLLDYTNWEKELGFLTLLMTRKKNVVKNYFINIYKTQLDSTSYIRDEDLEDMIANSVYEVFNEIADNYKQHLVTKYFGNDFELLRYITEEFYVDLTAAAITENNEKVKINAVQKKVAGLNRRNFDIEEEKNEEDDN